MIFPFVYLLLGKCFLSDSPYTDSGLKNKPLRKDKGNPFEIIEIQAMILYI